MEKICTDCDKRFDETMLFCMECGKPLITEDDLNKEIINCTFEFQCPLDWNKLQLTNNEDIRFCYKCNCNVYFAHSQLHLNSLARERKCIAVHPRNKVFYDENVRNEPPLMGVVLPPETIAHMEEQRKIRDEIYKSSQKPWRKFWK